MGQKVINKTKEEVYEILINSKNKKLFVQNFGYKDARSAQKICERFGLNLEDLGKNVGGAYGSPLSKGDIFDMLTVIDPNCDRIDGEIASLCQCACGQTKLIKNDFLKRKHTTSCGCKKGHDENNQIKNNQKFGTLTVINANYRTNEHSDSVSLCKCECGRILEVRNNCLRRGQYSCGCATMSKLEAKIGDLLKSGGLYYKKEVSFPDLNSFKGKPLRFDFGVYQKNKLVFLIEADGEQHFRHVTRFHKTVVEFHQAQERDRRKNSYCLAKGIPLIRVPYWDYDKLTLQSLLTNMEYRVKSPFHSDLLKRR